MNKEFSVYALKSIPDLTHKRIFKYITILSLDPYFSIFNQK